MPNPYQTLGNAPITDDTDYLTEEIQFDIDSNMRTIAVPTEGVVIGVQGDKNVNRVNFRMPAWYNGFDMSTFQPRINFVDPEGNVNYYTVTDMKIYDPDGNEVTTTPTTADIIYFTWLVDSYATNYVGTVVFNVRFAKFDSTTHALTQAFNTTKAACQVLEGITLADEITQEQQEDLLFHMTAELQDVTDSLKRDIEAKGANTLESIPDDYTELGDEVTQLQKDVSTFYELYLNQDVAITSGDNYFTIHLIKNHQYQLINNTSVTIAAWVWKNGSSVVDITAGLAPGQGATFTVTSDQSQIRVYSTGSGTVKVVDNNSVIQGIRSDISVVDGKVDDINKNIVVGNNLFNKYDTTDGYYLGYNTGTPAANGSYCYTNFYAPVEPETTYYINVRGAHICFYNSNKEYIDGWTDAFIPTFTTPDDAAYLRASIPTDAKSSCCINKGSSAIAYEPFSYKFKYSSQEKDYVLVAKDGSGDYTTVTEASANSPEGTIIYVKPGVYDNEVVTGSWSKKQYIIGASAKDCIIKNSRGEYSYPPLQIGAGLLQNLTIYSEYTGTQNRGTGETMSYAVHVESDTLANDNLTIKDCVLISDYAPGLGMGMRGGCTVTLDNTTFINTYNADALLFHDADNTAYAGEQNITVNHCLIYAPEGSTAIHLQSQQRSGTTVNVEMIGNRLKSTGSSTYVGINFYGGSGDNDDFLGVINYRLKETSWGNSDSTFDAD